MTRQEAEDFLYREARLLDSGQLETWLGLFAANGLYWIPINEQADPEREPSVIYDDATQRAKRVLQLLQGSHYAQVPPSRTVHCISNVEVEDGATSREVTLRCNVIVYELRPGDHQALQVDLGRPRAIVGQCEYHLRYESERWAIALKKVILIDRDLPLYNLTFIMLWIIKIYRGTILKNEFATVLVATDHSAHGCRLLIRNLHTGTEVYLDPLELEALTRIPHGQFGIWLDPDLGSHE